MFTVSLPDRQASDRIIFEERHNAYITCIGTKTSIGPEGNLEIDRGDRQGAGRIGGRGAGLDFWGGLGGWV